MYLNVPHGFLPKPKARKQYFWFPRNGTEDFEKGKWREAILTVGSFHSTVDVSTLNSSLFWVYLGLM